jgi:hypothetical protein
MNKTVCVALACAWLLLVPTTARADDGGFWDWLFHWDTKFVGLGTEFHARCWTGDGKKVEHCEEWFRNLPHLFHPGESVHEFTTYEGRQPARVEFAEIEHELNIRVTYLHSYGQRVPDATLPANDPLADDHRTVHGVKLLALYNRRLTGRLRGLEVAGGGGIIPLWGEDVHNVWRGDITGSVLYGLGSIFYLRGDVSYLTNTITGADFGHPESSMTISPGFNAAASIGFDLRRVGMFNAGPAR